MEVMREEEELVFLYQLVDGHAESSFACHIASLSGVPDELIKRAYQVRKFNLDFLRVRMRMTPSRCLINLPWILWG